jgi:hypothetical protein
MDETSKQQVKEVREILPLQPGEVARQDYEYERNGVSALFLMLAPLQGWRHVEVRNQPKALGMGAVSQRPSGRAFSRSGEDRAGDGQLEYAWTGFFLRGICSGRSAASHASL